MGCEKNYLINRITANWKKNAETARVDNFPWAGLAADAYRPLTSARLAWDDSSIYVYMETDETDLRMETRGFGPVHKDSCMEFFFCPEKNSSKYLNFELNPAGAMYLSLGTNRYNREILNIENFSNEFQIRANIHDSGWNLEYRISFDFLGSFFPGLEIKKGSQMRGNFYKCGDNTPRPHFGCWSPIDLQKPDFHCPEFFGTLTFV